MDLNAIKKAEAEFEAKYGKPKNAGPMSSGPLASRGPMSGPGPLGPRGPRPNLGMNNLLAQRLNTNKGQQFFDSGDYNMNKSGASGQGNRPIYLPMQNQAAKAALAQQQSNKENVFRKPE